MADLIVAEAIVKGAILATHNSSPSLSKTLSGRGIGLSDLDTSVEQMIEEMDGYYEGIREQLDTKKSSGVVNFTVRGNDETKWLAGQEGKILALEVDFQNSSGTSVIKRRCWSRIKKCTPMGDGNGVVMINVESVMYTDPTVTVT